MFSDRPITVTQATSVGPKAHRFKCGVSDNSFHYHLLCEDDRVKLEKFYRSFESAMFEFMPTHVKSDLLEAKELLDWKTFCDRVEVMCCLNATRNGSFPTHQDGDYSPSALMVLKDGHTCTLHDEVVAYFCFPRLGLAVPMCPGDVLVFNSQEPHCLSSRTNKDDVIYGLSIFLKSRVAGLNDDNIPLTNEQILLRDEFSTRSQNL